MNEKAGKRHGDADLRAALRRLVQGGPTAERRPFGYDMPPDASFTGRRFDVCVIGSGAAGAMVAAQCAAAGLDVLVLERGPHRGDRGFDELVEMSEPAYARDAKGVWDLSGYPWTSCNVGGGTVFYGAAAFRYRRVDFAAQEHLGDGDLPVDWPYPYEELAPYYAEVESLVGVSGTASDDPCHPDPEDEPPLPPVPRSLGGKVLAQAGESLGMRAFATPLAVASRPHRGRSGCVADAPCMDRACPHGAKGDADTVLLRPLSGLPNVVLLAGMAVVRLVRDRPTRAVAVEATHVEKGGSYTLTADAFVLAANAVQSAALLLRSTDRWSPQGVGNNGDMVGRGLSFKLNEYAEGYVPDAVPLSGSDDGNGPFSTVAFTDHYLDPDAPTGIGGLIYENRYPFRIAMNQPQRVLRLECLVADQPVRGNRVRLSRTAGPLGLPYVMLDYQTHPRDAARLEYVLDRMRDLLVEAGARWIRRIPTDYAQGSCHLHGTLRGGTDPTSSVADPDGRLHDVDNVYVADGGFMPFPGGVNPTLTIQAHALRVSRRVVRHRTRRFI